MSKPIKIAHISDLHFAHPSYSPFQFFSKRWLGNINLLFSRKRQYAPENLGQLIPLFKEQGVTHVLITGDLSTTSFEKEFEKALTCVKAFQEAGFTVFVLPGNHDHYTRQAYRDSLFYRYFPNEELKNKKISVTPLADKLWLICLDTALATSLISSQGYFSKEIEKQLESAVAKIPKDHAVLIANHFPLFGHDAPRKRLRRASTFRKLLERSPNIKLYLHGHTHRHCIADLRESGLPIILDSGSTSNKQNGSYNLISLTEKGCEVSVFKLKNQWDLTSQHQFIWSPHV